jgi:NADPH-dependent ferric siderophore reductase
MKPFSSMGRIQRVRREIRQREVEVARIEQLGSGFLKITFKGEALTDFTSDSFDDHIKFMFDNHAGESVRRDYTPRQFDCNKGELTIEFALHGDGEACNWARSAKIGQRAVIGGPRGSMIIPMDYDWHLLLGDASALPAIHRRLEELPATAQAIVIVQLANRDDQRSFDSRAQVTTRWVETPAQLLSAVRQLPLPAGDGFVWFGGDAALAADVRRLVIEEKHVAKEATKISAYWKHGTKDFHEPREH